MAWSSLVEGDEGYIGPSGKLFCLCQTPQNYVSHAWQHSIGQWLWLIRQSCHFRNKRSAVRIQTLANFIEHLFTVN